VHGPHVSKNRLDLTRLQAQSLLIIIDSCFLLSSTFRLGGDLRFHLNRRHFGEDVVRFWMAELSCAVVHLHSQGIVHRDIKPDNVLLDEKGHAHLTDFNIGCKLTPQKPMLTSQSGTVAYMAPEVFVGSGYGTSVDWWALGVVFYECIYNKRPFHTENVSELKKAIPTQTIEYPEKEGVSRECISAMRGVRPKKKCNLDPFSLFCSSQHLTHQRIVIHTTKIVLDKRPKRTIGMQRWN
jgi:serine/threonine protein kinase